MFPWQTNSILVLSLFSDMLCINLHYYGLRCGLHCLSYPYLLLYNAKLAFFLHVTAENGKKESAQVENGEFCVQEL